MSPESRFGSLAPNWARFFVLSPTTTSLPNSVTTTTTTTKDVFDLVFKSIVLKNPQS